MVFYIFLQFRINTKQRWKGCGKDIITYGEAVLCGIPEESLRLVFKHSSEERVFLRDIVEIAVKEDQYFFRKLYQNCVKFYIENCLKTEYAEHYWNILLITLIWNCMMQNALKVYGVYWRNTSVYIHCPKMMLILEPFTFKIVHIRQIWISLLRYRRRPNQEPER
jgi:hypothetical protein